jgi:hypothetical protein
MLQLDKKELEEAEKLAHELSLFNDIYIALSFVRPAWLNEINPEERKLLQNIRTQWNLDKESIKKKLSRNLGVILPRAID